MLERLTSRQRSVFFMALGQVVGFLFTPILSRLYSPSDFGAFLIFTNIFSILNISLTLRYEQAILYEKSSKGTQEIFSLSLFCSFIVLAAATPILLLAHPFDQLTSHIFLSIGLLIISALISSHQKIFMMLLTKWKNFEAISSINFLKPGLVGLIQASIGVVAIGFLPLAIGHSLAYLVLLVATLYFDKRLIKYLLRVKFTSNLTETAIKFKEYPIYNMTQNVVYVFSESVLPILIVAKYGLSAGGIYWFASKVTTVPSQVLVESLRPLVYKEVSSSMLKSRKVLSRIIRNSILLTTPFLFFSLMLFFVGPILFHFIFGDKWADGGHIASILLISSAINAAIVPFIATLPVIKLQHQFLVVELLCLVFKSLPLMVLSNYLKLEQVLLTSVALASSVYFIFMLVIVFKLKKMNYAN